MDTPHDRILVLVGLSHRTAALAVRERCSVSRERLPVLLAALHAEPCIDEVCVVSTCNRTEVLAAGIEADAVERAVRAHCFAGADDAALYSHRSAHAVIHAFSVCAGLQSQVLGEGEIQAQMKDAAAAAQAAGSSGPMLDALLQQALRVGKRVRTETALGQGTLSVAGAAVELVSKIQDDFNRVSALVIGAGETGLLVARHLRDRGIGRLTFANRTEARAADAAREFAAETAPFTELAEAIAAHDLVVVCVDAGGVLITVPLVSTARWPARDLPKVFVDLSVPRAIDPAMSGHRDAFLFDIDALDAVVARHRQDRAAEVERADRIIIDEVHKFLALRMYAAFSPAVAGLEDRFEEARQRWLGGCDAMERARLDTPSRELARHLLAAARTQMKEGARLAQSAEALERSYQAYRGKMQ